MRGWELAGESSLLGYGRGLHWGGDKGATWRRGSPEGEGSLRGGAAGGCWGPVPRGVVPAG